MSSIDNTLRGSLSDIPVSAERRDRFVLWDINSWDGTVEQMDDINTAWMREHTEEDVVGTISCLPGSFIVDNKMQDFISEGWNDAADAAGLEYLAIVSDGLEGIAVKGQIETENVAVEVFDNVEEAVAWMTEQV